MDDALRTITDRLDGHAGRLEAIEMSQAQHEKLLFGWFDQNTMTEYPGIYQEARDAAQAVRTFIADLQSMKSSAAKLVFRCVAGALSFGVSVVIATAFFLAHHWPAVSAGLSTAATYHAH